MAVNDLPQYAEGERHIATTRETRCAAAEVVHRLHLVHKKIIDERGGFSNPTLRKDRVMPATKDRYRLDPCPAEERVCEYYEDTCEGYEPRPRNANEGFVPDGSGVVYQECGGGRRIIRKKIGN